MTMKSNLVKILCLVAALAGASAALADWRVSKHPLGPGYLVQHFPGDPAQVVNTTYKTKRAANRAARVLNNAEDLAERDGDGK
jgi:hypothetical protein